MKEENNTKKDGIIKGIKDTVDMMMKHPIKTIILVGAISRALSRLIYGDKR